VGTQCTNNTTRCTTLFMPSPCKKGKPMRGPRVMPRYLPRSILHSRERGQCLVMDLKMLCVHIMIALVD
jgi:hypothetical protein